VALLFFLQPIVRGWARYQGRLSLRPALRVPESLDSVALRDSRLPLDETRYWSEQRLERIDFVKAMLQQLEQRGWPNRSDIGWSEFDVEIHGNRWSNLQLTTVAEDHPAGKQLIRCRLRAVWSLAAKVAFWSLLGLELLILGFAGRWWPGLLLPMLTLPLLGWFLHRQKRTVQSVATVFLDELAKERNLVKVKPL
jgi:hypothetical protein